MKPCSSLILESRRLNTRHQILEVVSQSAKTAKMIKRLLTTIEAFVAIIFLAQVGDSLPRLSTETRTVQIQRRRDDYVSSHRISLSQDPSTQWPLSYFGDVTIGGQPGKNALSVKTRFDTSTGSQFVVPGKKCSPSDGCAGEASKKYDESGRPEVRIRVTCPCVLTNLYL